VLEQFDRLVLQLNVARAFLLGDGGHERLMHARDPALGWRPGHRLDVAPAAPGSSRRGWEPQP
jgi:hypothetical protein